MSLLTVNIIGLHLAIQYINTKKLTKKNKKLIELSKT